MTQLRLLHLTVVRKLMVMHFVLSLDKVHESQVTNYLRQHESQMQHAK